VYSTLERYRPVVEGYHMSGEDPTPETGR
jgi:hypothetical protein